MKKTLNQLEVEAAFDAFKKQRELRRGRPIQPKVAEKPTTKVERPILQRS